MSKRVTLRAGDLELELAPEVGGSVARYTKAGRPLFRETPPDYTDVLQAACFPLAPYSNRIRDATFVFRGREVLIPSHRPHDPHLPHSPHALHGVGWREAWTARNHDDSSATLAFSYRGGEWPWPFEAAQTFTIDDDGLEATLSLTNTADEPAPAGLGFHPYFPCPPGTRLDADVAEVFPVDADLFPTGREPSLGRYALRDRMISGAGLDNGYGGWSGAATITWPDGAGLRITAPVPWFQVYAPTAEPVLCAEPVTHANGALNAPELEALALGLRILQPGETTTLNALFTPLPAGRGRGPLTK